MFENIERCRAEENPLITIEKGHESRCWYHERAPQLPRDAAADLELQGVDPFGWIHARHPTLRATAMRLAADAAVRAEPLVLELRSPSALRGRVVDADGRPVAGASVEVISVEPVVPGLNRAGVLTCLAPPAGLLLLGLSGKLAAGVLVPGAPCAGWGADWHSVIERSFWAQADLFAFGMGLAVAHVEIEDGRLPLFPRWRAALLAVALLVFIPCAATLGDGQLSYLPQNTGVALAAALFLGAVVLPQARGGAPWLPQMLQSRVLVAIGLASYSLFLWHEPLVHWLRLHGLTLGGWSGLSVNLLLVAAVAGTLSMLTYRLVEAPALRRKHTTRQMPVAQAKAAP